MKRSLSRVAAWVLMPCFFAPAVILGQALPVREQNTTLHLPAALPPATYYTEPAFGGLPFTKPTAIATPPGETNRVFVLDQAGTILVVTNLAEPNRSVFLDLTGKVSSGGEKGLLGLAFHPGFATNRQFFVFYTLSTRSSAGAGTHDRLSRFLASEYDPNVADAQSETVLISQYDEGDNHNGGDLHFGPDGYLYVALGDEGGGNDTFNNSQRIDKDFFSGLLRIDVDQRPGNLLPNAHAANTNAEGRFAYSIPQDNPFVATTSFNGQVVQPENVRTEFWAVGLRNPWRFSFDLPTGRLFCGDVGQGAWEEVDIIEKGGNYGWSYLEGYASGPRQSPPPEAVFAPPLLAYSHGSRTNQGFSVIGGLVYRGNRLSELFGAYIFADYVSGNIWATHYEQPTNAAFWRLTGEPGVVAFGTDPRNGDILLVDQAENMIKRLTWTNDPATDPLPQTLADTGAFADLSTLTPNAGILPYEINVPFWSDGADKWRWVSLPDTNVVFGFSELGAWGLPPGAVWIKHFGLLLTNGDSTSVRRLETRFLVRTTNDVYGLTYRWDDAQTNATLVPDQGLDEPVLVQDAGGIIRTQVWHYPSRAECRVCHTEQGGWALGFNTAQLNRGLGNGGRQTNQLLALAAAGYLDRQPPAPSRLPALAGASDTNHSVTFRVRSYLAANCVQCHQPSGSAVGFWDARFTVPADLERFVNVSLNDSPTGSSNRVFAPGSLEMSEALRRISMRGPGQMPPLASNELDHEAIALLSNWLTNTLVDYTPPATTYNEWSRAQFGATDKQGPSEDWDGDGMRNLTEYLYGFNATDPRSFWMLGAGGASGQVTLVFPKVPNRGGEIRIEVAPELGGPWTALPDEVPSRFFNRDGGFGVLTLDMAGRPAGYYRATMLDP